jgi:urea transport system substrate-binding protein
VIRRIAQSECDGVLMFLVGEDAVRFNRQFAEAGLDELCVRLTPLMDENMLLASEAANTTGIYTASGYFEALPTAENLDFSAWYARRFGWTLPC